MKKGFFKNLIAIIILIIVVLIGNILLHVYENGISKEYDTKTFIELQKIKNNLLEEKEYSFLDVDSYNKLFNESIILNNKCNYLKSINNGNGFIFSFKLKYKDNINLYGENYIYKSDEDYILSEMEISEINKKIESKCN